MDSQADKDAILKDIGLPTWTEFQNRFAKTILPPASLVAVYQQIVSLGIYDVIYKQQRKGQ